MRTPIQALSEAHGDDFTENRRDLAAALVRTETDPDGDMYVVVGGLPNSRTQRISTAKFKGGLDARDALRDVLYDLLTTVADEAQARFVFSERYTFDDGNGRRPPLDPDTVIGGQLKNAVRGTETA